MGAPAEPFGVAVSALGQAAARAVRRARFRFGCRQPVQAGIRRCSRTQNPGYVRRRRGVQLAAIVDCGADEETVARQELRTDPVNCAACASGGATGNDHGRRSSHPASPVHDAAQASGTAPLASGTGNMDDKARRLARSGAARIGSDNRPRATLAAGSRGGQCATYRRNEGTAALRAAARSRFPPTPRPAPTDDDAPGTRRLVQAPRWLRAARVPAR
jgi:hypothetical protein